MLRSGAHLIDGRYRLLARLGRGAAADVWSAQDERLQRAVAIKLYRGNQHRWRHEVEVLAGLRHPAVVALYDAGVDATPDGPCPYTVLEHLGVTLRDELAVARPSGARAAAIGADVAAALAHVHRQGLVHQDVKPANILLPVLDGRYAQPGRWAKLADFDVARRLADPDATPPGYTVGTANYLSPEQLRGRPAGPAADIYALGLVLLEALLGRRVYSGAVVTEADLDREPVIPSALGAGWRALLRNLTATDPAARPGADEVVSRLTRLNPTEPTFELRGAR